MHVLAFFAASDGIVLENLAVRFMAGGAPAKLPYQVFLLAELSSISCYNSFIFETIMMHTPGQAKYRTGFVVQHALVWLL